MCPNKNVEKVVPLIAVFYEIRSFFSDIRSLRGRISNLSNNSNNYCKYIISKMDSAVYLLSARIILKNATKFDGLPCTFSRLLVEKKFSKKLGGVGVLIS